MINKLYPRGNHKHSTVYLHKWKQIQEPVLSYSVKPDKSDPPKSSQFLSVLNSLAFKCFTFYVTIVKKGQVRLAV